MHNTIQFIVFTKILNNNNQKKYQKIMMIRNTLFRKLPDQITF